MISSSAIKEWRNKPIPINEVSLEPLQNKSVLYENIHQFIDQTISFIPLTQLIYAIQSTHPSHAFHSLNSFHTHSIHSETPFITCIQAIFHILHLQYTILCPMYTPIGDYKGIKLQYFPIARIYRNVYLHTSIGKDPYKNVHQQAYKRKNHYMIPHIHASTRKECFKNKQGKERVKQMGEK